MSRNGLGLENHDLLSLNWGLSAKYIKISLYISTVSVKSLSPHDGYLFFRKLKKERQLGLNL